MQVMPEKNLVKDFYPHKKETKHQNLCIFSDLYPLLLRLCRLQEVIQKLVKHILSNGPHLVSPQQALEVPQTQNFRGNKLLFCDKNYERPCTCFLPASSELCMVGFMCGIILPAKHPDIQSGIGPHEPGMRLFELCNHPAEIGGGVASESDRSKTWGMCVITWLSQTQNNTSYIIFISCYHAQWLSTAQFS